ncbi:MAG: FkbM family methyltransferase [Pyrinomonadaceae bacterium]
MSEISKRHWSDIATPDDLYYCYRLLLGREPDAEGWQHWIERLANEQFTCAKLAAYFRKSPEYVSGRRARGIKLLELDGFDLYVYEHDWDVGEQIVRTKRYEPHVTAFLKQHLRSGMTFVDVGANVGYFTLLGATLVGDAGKTVAVECSPENCELIYMSLHRNGLDQVLVYPFAVGDSQKLVSFVQGFSNGSVGELAEGGEESAIVPAVTLDFLLEREPRIDVVKMDIEGSEARAWQGMQRVIEKHHPLLLIEFFPALLEKISGVRAEEFLASIYARGYAATVLGSPRDGLRASSAADVMAAWAAQCQAVGDASRAYLDLAFCRS